VNHESSNDVQKITYIITPSKIVTTHKTNVGRITFFLAKQFLRSVLKRQDATSQMPSATAMDPNAPCISVSITVASKTIVPGQLKNTLNEGPITATTVTKWSPAAEAIVIPCWRYFFLFFNIIAPPSRTRTAICKNRLAVASINVIIINSETTSRAIDV